MMEHPSTGATDTRSDGSFRPQVSRHEQAELMALDAKIKALLPPHYENCYEEIQPISMGSAALKYGPDGKVAWDQIWTSFCHLALAGGPPHRGKLLEPVSANEVLAHPEQYKAVGNEIARGIQLVTELPVLPHLGPGWVGVRCTRAAMAAWLVRAIVAENVFARRDDVILYVPAGPHFKIEKEIKNVITAVAKTCHYWTCHMPGCRWSEETATLLEPALPTEAHASPDDYRSVVQAIETNICAATGLASVPAQYCGWVGVKCGTVKMAVWLMRAMAVENIVVRREENLVFLPANPKFVVGNKVQALCAAFANAHRLWCVNVNTTTK